MIALELQSAPSTDFREAAVPLSSAISIGTGGPFGAVGPIIATGGALGSLVGQLRSKLVACKLRSREPAFYCKGSEKGSCSFLAPKKQLGCRDSNPNKQIQNLLCYHYTTPQ